VGFVPLRRSRTGRSTQTGACLTPYVALPGFLILSAHCSLPDRPVLFHTGGALGVSPFRAFPSRGAVPPLGGRCLPDVAALPEPSQTRCPDSKRTEARCPLPGTLPRAMVVASAWTPPPTCTARCPFTFRPGPWTEIHRLCRPVPGPLCSRIVRAPGCPSEDLPPGDARCARPAGIVPASRGPGSEDP
jgi:hypothetical protein